MPHSFVAYIDESGDDGLCKFREPGAHGGSSSWLIISACVFRNTFDLEALRWRDEISNSMPEKKSRQIHFAQMNHSQRIFAAQCIAARPIRAISVISNKKTIPDGVYSEKNQLYFYLTRYLIERISWVCRDLRPEVPEGDGTVKITFSRRGGMSYRGFKKYLERLQSLADEQVHIHWPVIDVDGIDAQDHSRRAGLQLADIIASAFAAGFEPDKFGNCEKRYSELLRPIVYNRGGNFLSYGVKVVPNPERMELTPQQAETINIFN